MTTQHKIFLALGLAAVIAVGIVAGSLWSDHKLRRLEDRVETANRKADDIEQMAIEFEQAAKEHKAKIDYLENELARVRAEASKQDEKLQQTHIYTRNARGRVDAARRVRTNPATGEELCRKLAEVGHPCQ